MTGKRKPCRFRENEIARGVRAVRKGGGTVKRVTITPEGAVNIECGEPDAEPHNSTETNPWDEALYGEETAKVR
jgi:hypothetical protein